MESHGSSQHAHKIICELMDLSTTSVSSQRSDGTSRHKREIHLPADGCLVPVPSSGAFQRIRVRPVRADEHTPQLRRRVYSEVTLMLMDRPAPRVRVTDFCKVCSCGSERCDRTPLGTMRVDVPAQFERKGHQRLILHGQVHEARTDSSRSVECKLMDWPVIKVTHQGMPDREHPGPRRLWSPWQRCRVRKVSRIVGKRPEILKTPATSRHRSAQCP